MKQLLTTIAAVVLVGCGQPKDIWKAARKGNIDAVQEHLASGADVNGKDKNGFTPLHIAQSKEIVELLISNGADINAKNIFGGSPLHSAARGNKKEIVELLIAEGADVNAKEDGGQTPLHNVAFSDQKEIAEILIAHGANVNQIDDERVWAYTPLHYAVIGESSEVIKLLISKDVDINANSYHGTAFDVAVELKHEGIIGLLRKHGGKSGAEESLFIAAYLGNIEAVKKHLATGKDVNSDDIGGTPLHYAASGGSEEIVELLIAKGADVNAKGIDGTPLNFAVRNGHIEIVEYLILKGANVNSLSEENNIIETPLDYTLNAYENAVDLAKEEGISLSKEGAQHGQIASMLERFGGKRAIEVSIHAAADFGDVWSVKKFIAKGIDVNSKSVTEHTPLDYALKEKSWNTPKEKAARKETADLLRKHGGKTGEELKAEGK